MATKQVKDLQSRVDELVVKFDVGMKEIKKICLEDCASTEQVSSFKRDLCSKFEDLESSVVSSLQLVKNQITNIQKEMEAQATKISRLERERNRNTLLVHGLEETNTDIYQQVLNICTSNLGIDIKKTDLNECYRLGQKSSKRSKPRPIIVCFVNSWMRDEVFGAKRKLKGSKYLITEFLSVPTMVLFKEIRAVVGESVWTNRGQIILLREGRKIKIETEEQWQEIKGYYE